jgi:hypothetical protein
MMSFQDYPEIATVLTFKNFFDSSIIDAWYYHVAGL